MGWWSSSTWNLSQWGFAVGEWCSNHGDDGRSTIMDWWHNSKWNNCFFEAQNPSFLEQIWVSLLCITVWTTSAVFWIRPLLWLYEFQLFIFPIEITCAQEKLELWSRITHFRIHHWVFHFTARRPTTRTIKKHICESSASLGRMTAGDSWSITWWRYNRVEIQHMTRKHSSCFLT